MNTQIFFQYKPYKLASILLIIFCAAIASCSQHSAQQTSPAQELRISTATSSGHTSFRPNANTRFYFTPNIKRIIDTGLQLDEASINNIKQSILHRLQTKNGFKFSNADNADYAISAHIVYGNSYSESDFIQRYGVSPSLNESEHFQRGTLVILIHNTVNQIVWRGAIQIYANAGLEQDLARQRASQAVATLLNQIPTSI